MGEKKQQHAASGVTSRKRRERTSSDASDASDTLALSQGGASSSDSASTSTAVGPAAGHDASAGTSRPKRLAAVEAAARTERCCQLERAAAPQSLQDMARNSGVASPTAFCSPALPASAKLNFAAVPVTPSDRILQGEFANKFIRVGDEYQAVVLPFVTASMPSADDLPFRADKRVHIDFMPLSEPPKPVPILTLKEVKEAERRVAEQAERLAAAEAEAKKSEIPDDFDDDGEPVIPDGVTVGGFCLAVGKRAGETAKFKAKLLSVRRVSPHLLVKYVATADGKTAALLLPESPRAFLTCAHVEAWHPPTLTASPETSENVPSAAAERQFRVRPVVKGLELLSEAGGMRLHLDPRRHGEGYMGTGYQGVSNDYWPTGFKKLKPFVVHYNGAYAGRFATVEQAAVQYARLEEGMPPLTYDACQELDGVKQAS